ncbi:hypothetical protein [Sebaldella sp. S0638]|uniref:hypothetical protein n=1 Tax=Sebaldella sp. S0638 TaxID=2957809 RepID=UPI00209D2AE2|nr:hypothetical protein [Sebaldella sp. S0638]MCP1226145.1 hypothetical protein [Sebaldella sp. S0638]
MKKINFNDTNITADEILENVQELMKRQDSRATIMDYIESCVEPRKVDENNSEFKVAYIEKRKQVEKLREEVRTLLKENGELQEELKKKEEKIKSLEKKEEPKPKGVARGGRKAKKEKEDVNIDDVLKEGLSE